MNFSKIIDVHPKFFPDKVSLEEMKQKFRDMKNQEKQLLSPPVLIPAPIKSSSTSYAQFAPVGIPVEKYKYPSPGQNSYQYNSNECGCSDCMQNNKYLSVHIDQLYLTIKYLKNIIYMLIIVVILILAVLLKK